MILSNYRPISLLPLIAKTVEKYVHMVISDFVETNNLLHPSQSGFRQNLSMETSLLEVSESNRETLDSGGKAVLVLLDLSAAFDTVPHGTPLATAAGVWSRGHGVEVVRLLFGGQKPGGLVSPFLGQYATPECGCPTGRLYLEPCTF